MKNNNALKMRLIKMFTIQEGNSEVTDMGRVNDLLTLFKGEMIKLIGKDNGSHPCYQEENQLRASLRAKLEDIV